ncbi:hypothetical protein TEA_022487 [Camellia sinensis var. sinensis]|uniref:U3 small nucleolar RNA-associated protein 11 n=1 Tax=Camellia sinensis var. sinensis TaxID=542762 RepID=A0A4S4F3C9_CAMSN|nr:hypothetical protein TEA_022487 [Camellia sinensis var. sinensis]
MSSLRNAVYRRAHKERSQPQSRKKYGLLEKHKDYVVRAKAFHKKEDALRVTLIPFLLEDAKEMQLRTSKVGKVPVFEDVSFVIYLPGRMPKRCSASYRELEARKDRVNDLEKLYMDMAMQKELQKKGRKRKLREDEIVCPTSKPVYKWRPDRKR